MTHTKTALTALALAGWAAFPVLAGDFTPVDVKSVTCADFMAMETPERNDVSYHVERWIQDAANAAEAQALIGKYPASTAPADLTIEIEGHCKDATSGAGIIDRLMEHT